MSKSTLVAATLCLASLAACIPPDAPPPRFRPNPPYPPAPVEPYDPLTYDIAPRDEIRRDSPPPSTPPVPGVGNYPIATRTANPNQVLSPYEPFNVIDVEGFKSGQLARDPSNKKIFRVP